MNQIYMPTKIFFGRGCLSALDKVDYENILIIATKSLSEQYVKKIKEILGDRIENFVIGPIKGEPTEEHIKELNKKKTSKTDCIIGIGGGSYMDAAKVLAIQEESINDFGETSEVLPIITIPTTSGTGAELTKSGIVKIGDIKKGVRSERLFPKIAIVDPALTDSMPPNVTLYTGFDIFAHSVETFMSKESTPYTRMISETSLKLVLKYLPIAMKEFEKGTPSKETRDYLSYASMLQGFTLSNASTCLPHRMQYGLSTASDATHPEGLAALYRAWLKRVKPQISGHGHEKLIEFLDKLDINLTLTDIGIEKKDIEKIASRIEGDLSADPCYKDKEQLIRIMEESL